jgi:integrase
VLAILQAQPRRTEADGTGRDLIFGFGRGGFSDWSKRKIMLDQRILAARTAAGITDPMPGWRLHDLRRTCSTVMHDQLGIMPHIVETVLNHVGGHKAGVAGTYNKALYLDERRRALVRWGEYIEALIGGKKPSTIVELHKRR